MCIRACAHARECLCTCTATFSSNRVISISFYILNQIIKLLSAIRNDIYSSSLFISAI